MTKLITPIDENRKTLTAQVQERIREAIVKDELKPGTRIDQAQLAEDLNVSIVPVREALKALDAEGFVTIIPRRGAFVTNLSLQDMDDLYEARKMIEGEAIAHAALLLTEDDFRHMRHLTEKMKEAIANREVTEYIALNREFHLHIYSCLNNQYLIQVIQSLWERSELYRYRYVVVTHDTDAIYAEHMAIVEACEARNPERARQCATDHIQHACNGLRSYFEEQSNQATLEQDDS